MLAQVQTKEPLHFTKPFVLVTRVGNNDTNDAYYNPYQKYYEFDDMKMVFHYAHTCMKYNEKPVTALRITNFSMDHLIPKDKDDYTCPTKADYFHNFTAALDEYKRGIRVDM